MTARQSLTLVVPMLLWRLMMQYIGYSSYVSYLLCISLNIYDFFFSFRKLHFI